jgi:hypothetical protein
MSQNTNGQFRVLKLIKRENPGVAPKPVFFNNAPGDLCAIAKSSARQFGIDAANSTLEALSQGEHAPI